MNLIWFAIGLVIGIVLGVLAGMIVSAWLLVRAEEEMEQS
jgi:preprotein translocase subunit SecF